MSLLAVCRWGNSSPTRISTRCTSAISRKTRCGWSGTRWRQNVRRKTTLMMSTHTAPSIIGIQDTTAVFVRDMTLKAIRSVQRGGQALQTLMAVSKMPITLSTRSGFMTTCSIRWALTQLRICLSTRLCSTIPIRLGATSCLHPKR